MFPFKYHLKKKQNTKTFIPFNIPVTFHWITMTLPLMYNLIGLENAFSIL